MLEKEQIPTRLEYGGPDGVMDLVQLSLARSSRLRGAIEADSFSELTALHPEYKDLIEQRGAEFDVAIRGLIITVMAVRKKLDLYAKDTDGLYGSDYFPWHDKLMQNLEQRGRAEDFRLIIVRQELGSTAVRELITV